MANTQIVTWGNSLAVRIPKPLAEQAGLGEGDRISLQAAEGQIELRRSEQVPTLKELVAQMTAEDRYPETSTGSERCKEKVEWWPPTCRRPGTSFGWTAIRIVVEGKPNDVRH